MRKLIAAPEGAGEWSGNPAFRTVLATLVTPATRLEDRCASFYPMNGETIAQTVMGKIEGAHHPDNMGTRQGATSRYAAY